MRSTYLFLTTVLVMSQSELCAHDLFPPDWRSDPRTVNAVWNDWTHITPPLTAPDSISPETFVGRVQLPMSSEGVQMWNLENGVLVVSGDLSINLQNYSYNRVGKDIRIQYTIDGSGDDLQIDTDVSAKTPSGTVVITGVQPTSAGQSYDEATGYWTHAWDFHLPFNPESETIKLNLIGTKGWAAIDQLIIDTRCIVPEPGSLLLLCLGVVVALRQRIGLRFG